ncbi:ethylene-responsive transcription factor RAP2-7 isoform X1 [Arachis hypogaea]|uniref:ethylene-responsive transcription factor RAP2-7 isoform X1 n=1 Tax=Arachis hypogaea TaxID=3818 RepID=UPI000DED0318|nr:APETALA2-like protein 1 isoform X2 [Arachis hypogaea]
MHVKETIGKRRFGYGDCDAFHDAGLMTRLLSNAMEGKQVTNFEPSTYEGEMKSSAINEAGSPNLELNLAIATPGHGLKENRGQLQFPWVPYSMHAGRTMVETNVNSVIGNPSSERLVATEEHPSPWNGVNPSFFPNQERADRISIDHSKGLPGWPWQMHNQITATLVPPFSVAASSGFSISAPFPSSAIFPVWHVADVPKDDKFD